MEYNIEMTGRQMDKHEKLKRELGKLLEGAVTDAKEALDKYSKDTSLFEVCPEIVVHPKDVADVKKLVKFVAKHRDEYEGLSLTGRSAGSDMTGGPLSESIVLGFTEHFTDFSIDKEKMEVTAEPGVYYRDFEKQAKPDGLYFPSYPASKSLCAFGGMVMNNAGGEKTLRYGQTRDHVKEVKMVLADGNEYTFGEISKEELEKKMAQEDFEGEVYRKIFELIDKNYELVMGAKPDTSKNSSGYDIWDIYDRERGTFNLAQLFVGSQGTLGILTEARMGLMKEKPHKKLVTLFFKDWDELPGVVNAILPYKPETLEAFDWATMKLGIRFMPEIAKKAGESFLRFAFRFLPEAWLGVKMLGIPHLILLIELAEDSEEEVERKAKDIQKELEGFRVWTRVVETEKEQNKYWVMRRQSFNLLREHVKGKRTAPFIDDFAVDPNDVPEFLPKLLGILKTHGIKANIAGHAGNGNFHIIPLMDLSNRMMRDKIVIVADKVYALINEYNGTITAEHNDGIMRTPYVEDMFGEEVYGLFKDVKNILDPKNIFNPGKKVNGSKDYLREHIATEN